MTGTTIKNILAGVFGLLVIVHFAMDNRRRDEVHEERKAALAEAQTLLDEATAAAAKADQTDNQDDRLASERAMGRVEGALRVLDPSDPRP